MDSSSGDPDLRVPNPAPLILKLVPPVLTMLALMDEDKMLRSYEPASVPVPGNTPTVSDTNRLPPDPPAKMHTTDE